MTARRSFHPARGRKGNALLLVSGLLVMLTLIAAAYLSRSRAQRTTAAAIHDTVGDASRAQLIAQHLAADVTQHLFLRPVDPNSVGAGIFGGNSAAARKNPSPYDARYGVEAASTFIGANGRGDMLSDALSPAEPLRVAGAASGEGDGWPDGYNFAPYSVIPWTNWPDHVAPVDLDGGGDPSTNRFFPIQPAPDVFTSFATPGSLSNNPIGNPGFGDTRWLRSSEPVRMTEWRLLPATNSTPMPTVPDGAFFSHWQHLSFPPTANNGWRVVPDISDIEGHTMAFGEAALGKFAPATTITAGTFVGGAMTGDMASTRDGLGTPYEQWSAYRRPTPIATAGLTATSNDPSNAAVAKWVSDFAARRNLWFNPTEYMNTMGAGSAVQAGNGTRMLPNLFKLDDPLGLGRASNPTATPVPPSDEYIENSPRNIVSRTFADADGDGWTDSFWFLAPVGQEKNVRTVVGVSIVDNAGMVDVNVATRADRHTTVGFTPADVALVTSEPEGAYIGKPDEPSELGSAPWTDTRVGLFDSTRNFARGRWSTGDPKVAATNNPSGTRTDLYDATQFEQGFDAYRWAGSPTPMMPGSLTGGWSWTTLQQGEQTFLSSLGLWYAPGGTDRPEQNFWNGYLHTPARSAARDPLDLATPRIDLVFPNVRDQLNFGPWLASAPPGTGVRWQQSEPVYATYVGSGGGPGDLANWRWESWFDTSFSPGARPPTNAPNVQGAYPGSPFMRPEERTRWFRAAISGDLIAYGPFSFMGTAHVGGSWRDATQGMRLGTTTRDFLGESIPFRPFEPADEIELRAYGGLNDAGAITRLERALNGDSLSRENSSVPDTLLRSSVLAAESGKAGMQLNSAQWVKDLRRKITTVSGQRNELMPPHLWIGRSYLAPSRAVGNPYELYQNATLWLDLHPQVPGPIDEDGDGVISSTELRWGSYDLMRVTTSNDPFPDGITISVTPPVLSPSDWTRGVNLFEHMNRKFDLRQPLVIQRRRLQTDLETLFRPYLNEFGLVDERGFPRVAYAYSAQEQRRAMIDFALNARQRLRPALRTVSPQRQRINPASGDVWLSSLRDLGPRQASTVSDGVVNVAYASYTDRFLDQLRMTFDARVAGAVEPADRQGMLASDRKGLATLGDLAWRSAWSTEALTASLAANLATWRSRPDMIREVSAVTRELGSSNTPLRPVWQPILPWHESAAAQKLPDGNPMVDTSGLLKYEGAAFSAVRHRPDFGDSPVFNDPLRGMREFSLAQTIRAVDPSRPSKITNTAWGESLVAGGSGGMPNADHPAKTEEPSEDTADIVFPGNEKQPFLSECFFGWVYPATTVTKNGVVDLPRSPGRMISSALGTRDTLVSPAPPPVHPEDADTWTPEEQAHLQRTKFVAVVNGQVGRPRLVPDPSDPRNNPVVEYFPKRSPAERDADPSLAARNLIPSALAFNWARGLTRQADAASQPPIKMPPPRPGAPSIPPVEMRMVPEPERDGFRDELNEIRTPVLVVQVANPYNEPLRLSDFRLNIFGNLYDFPDYELDADGRVVLDASGEPVPLMLPPATEFQPSTATVYLIADSVGVPKTTAWFPSLNGGGVMRGSFPLENPFTRIRYERVNQNDLSTVAMWDPLFRRRWLDYFDLYEYTDGKHLGRSATEVQAAQPEPDIRPEPNPCDTTALLPQRHIVWDKSTSPVTSCLFSQPTWLDDQRSSGPGTAAVAQAEDLRSRLSRSKLLNAMDRSDVTSCVGGIPARSAHKHRIDDLWKFKYSLTPDAMRSGVVLERILRDPSDRNPTWRVETVGGTTADFDSVANLFQISAISPIESTIDRYRLRFWPLYGSAWSIDPTTKRITRSTIVFPRDSREPSTIFPPRDSTAPGGGVNIARTSALDANATPIIEPTTLVIDRFDADDDFNHWTTVANGPLNPDGRAEAPFEQARQPETAYEAAVLRGGLAGGSFTYGYPLPVDPASTTEATRFGIGVTGTPLARPDDQRARFFESPHLNQDRNLVTGGRFWTACAQITLPPTRHRWPDGRDRRMMGLNDAWAGMNGAYGADAFDGAKYFGSGDGKGDVLNPRRDAYWMNWRHLPSLPVMLGATMMTSDSPTPVMVQDLLSRLPSRIIYEGADVGDPYPVRLLTGDLLTPWPRASYTVEYFVGDVNESTTAGNGAWKSEADLFPSWRSTGSSALSSPELLDPGTAWPTVPFDKNVPHGELDADELRAFCRAFPALDRDANGVPDEMQKIFVGFDEPEGNPGSFPPPTALSLIAARSTVPDLTLGMQNTASPYIDQGGGYSFEFGTLIDAVAKPGESEVPMLPPVRGLGTSGGFRGSPEYSVISNGFAGQEDRKPGFSSWARWNGTLNPTAQSTFNPAAAQQVGTFTAFPTEQEWVPTPEEYNSAHIATESAVDPSFMLPGIVLRTGTESRDYFTTWTRVSRSWARNYHARFATRLGSDPALPSNNSTEQGRVQQAWDALIRPGSLLARQKNLAAATGVLNARNAASPGSGNSIQDLAALNLPLWTWERQIVTSSTANTVDPEAFESGRAGVLESETPFDNTRKDQDRNVMASEDNVSATYGASGPDALAPRFAFAQRTEPDRCDKPVDMRQDLAADYTPMTWRGDFRPLRQELIGYQASRFQQPTSTTGTPGGNQGQGGGGASGPGSGGSSGSASANPRVWPEEIARSGVPIYRAPAWRPQNGFSNPYFAYFKDPAQDGRPSSGGPRPNLYMAREVRWTAANNGEFLTAAGDMFAMEPAGSDKLWDPDVWQPDPPPGADGNGTPTPYETDLLWMHRSRKFNWLTSPVIAPLPDMQGLGWAGTGADPVSTLDGNDPLPYSAYPELIMRKPTAFNCQTVVDDRLSRNFPNLPASGGLLALQGNPGGSLARGYRRFLFAKYADFLVDSGGFERRDNTTRFVYPPWARPAPRPLERAMSATRPDLPSLPSPLVDLIQGPSGSYRARWVSDAGNYYATGVDLFPFGDSLSLYRVYMGDKGGRLVDHTGRMLILDRATMRPALHNGDVLAIAGSPIAEMQRNLGLSADQTTTVGGPTQWLMQGVWNTLDRNPHGGSLQMLHKDDDFEQLGELTDVFLWGPAYRVYRNPASSATNGGTDWSSYIATPPTSASSNGPFVKFDRNARASRGGWLRPTDLQTTVNYYEQGGLNGVAVTRGVNSDGASILVPPRLVSQCRATFAEIMTGRVPGFPVGEGPMVNRLQTDPPNIAFHQPERGSVTDPAWGTPIQMGGTSALRTPYGPNVPWGMRVFDAFTLDGPGGVLRYDWRDQFAGRVVTMNNTDGSLTASGTSNMRPFESTGGNAGNPNFNPKEQDGGPATGNEFTGTQFSAARPAGALMPADVYRDETVRQVAGNVSALSVPVVTRASMAQWEHDRSPSLAGGYQGRPVPGMINVNTAPVEVLRAMPHMTQMVYDDAGRSRFGGSLDYGLTSYAQGEPFGFASGKGGLGGSLPAVSGRSVLNTDGQFVNLSTNGNRGANPATRLAETLVTYRDGLNSNLSLAAAAANATVTDWYTHDTKDPMRPATGGKRVSPASGADATIADAYPIYPTYVDRGEAAGAVSATGSSAAVIGTGAGNSVTGPRRDPFWYVYFNRGMQSGTGVTTTAEILGMARTTRTRRNGSGPPTSLPVATGFSAFPDWQYDMGWSSRLAGLDPYRTEREDPASGQGYQSYLTSASQQLGSDPLDARLSTDRQGVRTFDYSLVDGSNNTTGDPTPDNIRDLTVADAFRLEPDTVAGDSEERNMLFKGISNIVSTRSDVFTAYFRVKTVKQGADGRWNAMDPETLLSEARYVMCIDRSNVNRPTDKPRIVYFTQVKD